MKLKSIQREFFEGITGRQDLRSSLQLIRKVPGLNSKKRFEIYSKAYGLRLKEALSIDFAMTRKFLGPRKFDRYADSYISIKASCFSSLNEFGSQFALFLRRYPQTRVASELARFEWEMIRIHHSLEINSSLDRDMVDFANAKPENIYFVLDPSVRLFASQLEVDRLYEAKDPKRLRFCRQKVNLCLYRKINKVQWWRPTTTEIKVLRALLKGRSLAEISILPGLVAQDVSKVFSDFKAWGLLRGMALESPVPKITGGL